MDDQVAAYNGKHGLADKGGTIRRGCPYKREEVARASRQPTGLHAEHEFRGNVIRGGIGREQPQGGLVSKHHQTRDSERGLAKPRDGLAQRMEVLKAGGHSCSAWTWSLSYCSDSSYHVSPLPQLSHNSGLKWALSYECLGTAGHRRLVVVDTTDHRTSPITDQSIKTLTSE
jgi:hypothetical protein